MKLLESDIAVVIEPDEPAEAAVIWLHGLGADGHDFVPLVPELGLADLSIRFLFPHAPVRPVTINNGMKMRAWYDIPSLTDLRKQDEAGIRDSAGILGNFVQTQLDLGIPAEKIVLAGFSQGGAIVLHAGLRHPARLAGLLALSTYLPLNEKLDAEALPDRHDTPILMCHGQQDATLPMQLGEWTRDLLTDKGYAVDWREYPMQHAVCAEEIEHIAEWLRERLQP